MRINQYTLKSVKIFDSRNGIGFSANIYFQNKQIGCVLDKGDGSIVFDIRILNKFQEHEKVADTDFIERLFNLHLVEKDYKRIIKKHPECCCAYVYYGSTKDISINPDEIYHIKKDISESDFRKYLDKKGLGENIERIVIYRSLDDFNINDSAKKGEESDA